MIRRNNNPHGLKESGKTFIVCPNHPIYNKLKSGQCNNLHNRDVEDNNVTNIQQSLDMMNALKYQPIVVDNELNIIDGQNRYIAATTHNPPLDIHIMFTDNEIDSEALMLLLNTGPVYRWKLKNYVNYYAQSGKYDAYKNFKSCCIQYPEINPSIMVSIFLGVNYRLRGDDMHQFKRGHLDSQMEKRGMNMQKVYHTLSQMYMLKGAPTNPTLSNKAFKLQNLQLALIRVLSDHEFDYHAFLKKIRKTAHNLDSLRTADHIEQEIYDIVYRRKA